MTPRERERSAGRAPMRAPGGRMRRRRVRPVYAAARSTKKDRARLTPRPGEGPVRARRRPLVTFPILLGTLLPGQSRRPRGTPRADDAVLKGPLFSLPPRSPPLSFVLFFLSSFLSFAERVSYVSRSHRFIDTRRYFVGRPIRRRPDRVGNYAKR